MGARKKRKIHVAKPASATEIIEALGITQRDIVAAKKALGDSSPRKKS